ncbi:MAG: type IV pilus modification PilV family protein [Gemmatimonadota bacterium]
MMRNTIFTALDDESGFGLVEAMIAITILVIGLLAVSGLTLATAAQARIADLRNDQMIAGQSMIEQMRTEDFDGLASRVDTVSSDYRIFYVTSTVVDLSARAKQVTVSIAPANPGLTARSFDAVLHKPRSLPAAP